MADKDKPGKVLFSLSEIDKNIHQLSVQKKDIEQRLAGMGSQISGMKEQLQRLDGNYKDAVSRQSLEETRLKDEEKRIVDRRRQLTALGGAKSAKLVERELDIATRVIESMEKNALETIANAEKVKLNMSDVQDRLQHIEVEFENQTQSGQSSIESLQKEIVGLTTQREKILPSLEDRLKNLYKRVLTHYPGDALARALNGSCMSCYRALPTQTYNQILAGNMLIQCPGCSRILVYLEE